MILSIFGSPVFYTDITRLIVPQQKKMNSHSPRPRVTTSIKGLTVADSPLNGVKLDLGLFILVGLVLLVLLENISISQWLRFTILGTWALFMLTWIVFKTQAIIKKTALQGNALNENKTQSSDSDTESKSDVGNV